MHTEPQAIIVMGVTGSGKSTVALGLALHYGCTFLDADDFHTSQAKAQMASGVPLTDAQRQPWVHALAAELVRHASRGECCVMAFSGLRMAHRHQLRACGVPLRFVCLQANAEAIRQRLALREGHFMPPQLLASQFDAWQPPQAESDVIGIDAEGTPAEVLARAIRTLDAAAPPITPC